MEFRVKIRGSFDAGDGYRRIDRMRAVGLDPSGLKKTSYTEISAVVPEGFARRFPEFEEDFFSSIRNYCDWPEWLKAGDLVQGEVDLQFNPAMPARRIAEIWMILRGGKEDNPLDLIPEE